LLEPSAIFIDLVITPKGQPPERLVFSCPYRYEAMIWGIKVSAYII
jgi:hypothetical protein